MPNRYSIFVLYLLAYFLSYFYRSTNAVIADDLVRDLNLTPEQLGLMTGVFFAVFALAQLIIGPALDRFGARLTTASLILSAVLGSFLFASTDSFLLLILGRGLIGLGMAGVLMGSLKAFANWFPGERFATVSGVFVALGASGSLFATVPLESLSNILGWRQVFIWGAGLTLLSSLLLFGFVRDTPASQENQRHKEQQGTLLDVLRNHRFWRIAFLNFAMVGSFFSYQSLWMGPYLQDAQRLSAATASQLLLVLAAASVAGFFASGYLTDHWGVLRTMISSSSLFFTVQLLLALAINQASLLYLALLMLLFGFSGAFNIQLYSHVRKLFPRYLIGRALALTNLFGIGAVSILQWFLGVLIGRSALPNGHYAPGAFRGLFLLTALLGFTSLIVYLSFLRKTEPKYK
ncbi:MAG: MFS transporter [Trueperaceae bacterium]|nr:MFS transporter [Trueperaceae bacterium]